MRFEFRSWQIAPLFCGRILCGWFRSPIDNCFGPWYYRSAHKACRRNGESMTEQDRAYVERIEAWRRKMEESLRADDGWLTVAGLFWLSEGTNSVGADPASDIVLPPGSAPEHVGSFDFHGGQTTLRVTGDALVTVNGAPASTAMIKSDAEGKPDLVAIGDLTMFVIHRGQRWAIRLRDKQSHARQTFTGRR